MNAARNEKVAGDPTKCDPTLQNIPAPEVAEHQDHSAPRSSLQVLRTQFYTDDEQGRARSSFEFDAHYKVSTLQPSTSYQQVNQLPAYTLREPNRHYQTSAEQQIASTQKHQFMQKQ